jgi:hypothetical protein
MRAVGCWKGRLLLVLCCFSLPPSAVAASFRYYCDLRDEPIVTLVYEGGRYVQVGRNTTSSLNDINGSFSAGDVHIEFGQPGDNIDANDNPSSLVEAKKCFCWDLGRRNRSVDYYCAANNQITHCGIPSLTTSTYGLDDDFPGCVNVRETTTFARGVWPLIVISFLFLTCFLFFTMRGRDALSYGLGLAAPQWNTWRVERMIHQRPDRANGLMIRYFRFEQSRIRAEAFSLEQSGIWAQWGMCGCGTFTDRYVFCWDQNVSLTLFHVLLCFRLSHAIPLFAGANSAWA